MTFREYLKDIKGDVCIRVSPRFEGDIVVYSAVYALYKLLEESGNTVCVSWPGHLPPAANRVFPMPLAGDGKGATVSIEKNKVVFNGKEFSYKYTPAELLIDGLDEPDDVLAALFVSLYAGTRGFAMDDVSDEVLQWFQRLLEKGFPHYKYVDLIYVISSPDVFHVWGEVMQNAQLKDDIVVSVYEKDDTLIPPEWFKVASYLARYTGKGRVYVKREQGYEYFDADGSRGMVDSI
ncbi:MAG: hypothetical protein GXO59_00465 [Dictyoglomi bacterium]|nr:hypothetical protein [Dictyoglomota bacterium]